MHTEQFYDQRIYRDTPFQKGDAVLDIEATGHFWRTALITRADLITWQDEEKALHRFWLSEKEADEYEILTCLQEALSDTNRLITFNGRAFDLPFLHQKYKAYGLADPLTGKENMDLFLLLKRLSSFLALPSRKLCDGAAFLGIEERIKSDAQRTLELMSMLRYDSFLEGQFAISDVRLDEDHLIYTLDAEYAFPRPVSVHDASFHLRFEESGRVLLSARIYRQMLRYYHTDPENYEYLPLEGFAIHKSASSFVDPGRKEKATRENCFHLVRADEGFLRDPGKAEAYLRAVMGFLRSR